MHAVDQHLAKNKACEAVRHWPRGVTVSTLDSESSERGSNPREAFAWIGKAAHWTRCHFDLRTCTINHAHHVATPHEHKCAARALLISGYLNTSPPP